MGTTITPQVNISITTSGASAAVSSMGRVASAAKSMGQTFDKSSANISSGTSAIGKAWNRMVSIISAYAIINAVRSAETAILDLGRNVVESVGDYQRLGMVIEIAGAREVQANYLREKQIISLDEAYRLASTDAQKYLKQTQDIALTVPVKEKSIADTFRTLAGYGLGVEGSMAYTKALSAFGIATGRTSDEIYRLALALGQMRAKGKLAGEEMRQFTNAGLSMEMIVTALQRHFPKLGVTVSNFYTKMRKGSLKSEYILPALLAELQEFEGMAPRIAKTWAGIPDMITNIGRVVNRTAFGPLLEEFTKPFGAFIDMFDPVKGAKVWQGISQFGAALAKDIRPLTEWLTNQGVPALERFYEGLAGTGSAAERLGKALSDAFSLDIGAGQFGLVDVLSKLWDKADVAGSVNAGLRAGSNFIKNLIRIMGDSAPLIAMAIADLLNNVKLTELDLPGIFEATEDALIKLESDPRMIKASEDIGIGIGHGIGSGLDIFLLADPFSSKAKESGNNIVPKFLEGIGEGLMSSVAIRRATETANQLGFLLVYSLNQAANTASQLLFIGLHLPEALWNVIQRDMPEFRRYINDAFSSMIGDADLAAGVERLRLNVNSQISGVFSALKLGEAADSLRRAIYDLFSGSFTGSDAALERGGGNQFTPLGVSIVGSIVSSISAEILKQFPSLNIDLQTGVGLAVTDSLSGIRKHGAAIVDGLYAGMENAWKNAADIPGTPMWIAEKIKTELANALGAHSPAQALIPLGEAGPQGLQQGWLNAAPALLSTVRGTVNQIIDMMDAVANRQWSMSWLTGHVPGTMFGQEQVLQNITTAVDAMAQSIGASARYGAASISELGQSSDSAMGSLFDFADAAEEGDEELDGLSKRAAQAADSLGGLVGLKPSGESPSGGSPSGAPREDAWDELARRFKAAAKEGEGNPWFEMYRANLPAWARGDEGLSKQAFAAEAERFYENPLAVQAQYAGQAGVTEMVRKLAQDTATNLQNQFAQSQLRNGVIGFMLQNPQQAGLLQQWGQKTGTDIKSALQSGQIPTLEQLLLGIGFGPNPSPIGGFAGAGPNANTGGIPGYIQSVADIAGMNGPLGLAFTDLYLRGITPLNVGLGVDMVKNTDLATDNMDTDFTESGQKMYSAFVKGKDGLAELDAKAKEVGEAVRNEYFKDFTQVITIEIRYEGSEGGGGGGPSGGGSYNTGGSTGGTGGVIGMQRGLYWKVPGAGSGDIVPFRAMVEPGEIVQIIPKRQANAMPVAAHKSLVINIGSISNGWTEAELKHRVQQWAFAED